jgi:uncharacterized protein YbjT (DUF2867 family)
MADPPKPRIALVAGASGMVGLQLVRALLAAPEYQRVIALSRRALPLDHARLANRIVRFESLEKDMAGMSCQDAFCCLGTTLKAAGSKAAFVAVDKDLVVRFARCAHAAGASSFVAVTSAEAVVDSKNFYLRVKGETERELEAVRFQTLHLMRPGLLIGDRRDWRPAEAAARLLAPLFNPLLQGRYKAWRAIPAATVAAAMRGAALSGRRGLFRYGYSEMLKLAGKD